jgi:hypothetical protein
MAEPPLSLSQVWMVAAFAVVMVAGAVYVSILCDLPLSFSSTRS